MSGFRLSRQADSDLRLIWDYIAQDNLAAADRLIGKIIDGFEMLGRQPLMGTPCDEVRRGLRHFTVENHVIYHSVADETVTIERVMRGSRDIRRSF